MKVMRRFAKDFLHRMGYSVRSLGARSSITGIDLVSDVSVLLGRPVSPILFDVGANEGQTVLEMTRGFPKAKVFSFEPSPKTFQSLVKHFGLRSNIRLENLALGDSLGDLPFTVCEDWSVNDSLLAPAWSSKTTVVSVAVTTVESYCQSHSIQEIDWLKIDTQGYDLRVLHGARQMLTEGRIQLVSAEAIFNRMYDGQPTLSDLLLFMTECKYRVSGFYEQEYVNNKLSYCNVLWARDV